MITNQADIAEMIAGLSAARRAKGAKGPKTFARIYLDHHLTLPPSRMHRELFAQLRDATRTRDARIAIAAPRGHAKSTVVSLAYALWSVLYGHEQHVIILSATRELAVNLLRSLVHELETNERLSADFPEVCAERRPKPWRDNHVVLPTGPAVRALGAGQAIRGTKHRQFRPSLIIADDLEEQEQAESPDQRNKLRGWFERAVLKAGDHRTNVIVVGTILHYDSLLARLTNPKRSPGWQSAVYRAVESFADRVDLWDAWERIRNGEERTTRGRSGPEAALAVYEHHRDDLLTGTKVLWPEREGYLQLMEIRCDEGRSSFQAEKQNEPLDPDECMLREGEIRFWDDEYKGPDELIASLGSRARFFGACDPSLGRQANRGDYTALVTVVKDERTGVCYVIGADIARRKPAVTIQSILALAKMHRFEWFAFETNQFQELMADELERQVRVEGLRLYVKRVQHASHKQTRIQSLQPLIAQGRLRFSRRHYLLLEQLRLFPLAAHDDGPDALEMAVTEAAHDRGRVAMVTI